MVSCNSSIALGGKTHLLSYEELWVILSDVKKGGECYLDAALMFK